MQSHPSGNWGLHAKFHNPSTTPTSSFFSKKCHPPPRWRGGGTNSNFINQISRHFRQFWTLFIFFLKKITQPQPPRGVGGQIFFGCNLILLVTYGRMQNFKTLAQFLLGKFRWGLFLLPCESKVNSQDSPGVGVWQKSIFSVEISRDQSQINP